MLRSATVFEIWMLGLVQVFDMLLIQVLGVCFVFEDGFECLTGFQFEAYISF